MIVVTGAPSGIDKRTGLGLSIDVLIDELTVVMDTHAKNHLNGLPMRDGFYILITALAERAAAVILMANGVLDTGDDELVGVLTDTVTGILETSRGVDE